MSKYADVYLCPIREENIPAYKKMATAVGKIFLKHGAIRYREYLASDLNTEDVVPFPKVVKLKPGETLIYAAVEFKSEAQRNKVMKAVMADAELTAMCSPDDKQLFDFKRMVYGGFKVIVDL
jgi:alkaline phosphatase